MHLAGYHKIDLIGFHREAFKINGVCSAAFGKKYHMVKAVLMGHAKVLMFLQIWRKPADQQVIVLMI